MKKIEVVKNSREFDSIIKNSRYQKNNEFIIYFCNNDKGIDRFGISVGKKIGNAVIRNYYKRVIRNICDKSKNLYSKGKDYIIIVRKGITLLGYDDINNSFNSLIKKINEEKRNNYEEKN